VHNFWLVDGDINDDYECVCIPAFLVGHAHRMFPVPPHIAICGLSGCTIFYDIIL